MLGIHRRKDKSKKPPKIHWQDKPVVELMARQREALEKIEGQYTEAEDITQDPAQKILNLQKTQNSINSECAYVDEFLKTTAKNNAGSFCSKTEQKIELRRMHRRSPELAVLTEQMESLRSNISEALKKAVYDPPISDIRNSHSYAQAFDACAKLEKRVDAEIRGDQAVKNSTARRNTAPAAPRPAA